MDGVILVPSLNRANQVKEFFKTYRETETKIPVWVLIDKEDPKKEDYFALELPQGSKIVVTGNARSMGEKFEAIFDDVKDLDFITILNDDHRFRTKNWDNVVLSALNGTNLVFTNDGPEPSKPWNFPKRLCGAITISGQCLRALGYIFPKGLKHFYSDDVWGQLFGRANAALGIGEVCVEHVHGYLHPEQRDETYKLVNGDAGENKFHVVNPSGGFWDNDREVYDAWLKNDAEKDIQKIIDIQPKAGVMIATPFHDHMCAIQYMLGMMDVTAAMLQQNIYFEVARVVGSSLITHARNSLVDMFLKSRCQKLIMIDSDQGFDRNIFFRIMGSSRRITAAITPHKRFPINLNFEPLEEDYHFFKDLNNKSIEELQAFSQAKADANGEIQVARCGTGMVAIDRSVFELMKPHVKKYFAFDQRTDVEHYEFFKMGELDGRFRGEDWQFNMLAKELKIPTFINVTQVIPHIGQHSFAA